MPKYIKALTNDELLELIADELVQTHIETGIDLAYWATAREIVERFYEVTTTVEIFNKKVKKDEDLF